MCRSLVAWHLSTTNDTDFVQKSQAKLFATNKVKQPVEILHLFSTFLRKELPADTSPLTIP